MGATIDARTFREAMARFLQSLEKHREELDSLNVYPVPDGDTGTNMLLTQRAVDEAVGGGDARTLRDLGQTVSSAALMGARGNSGVILSQVLRGLCTRLCRGEEPGPADLAEALREAAEQAYRAVGDPVEGTMLTVIADAAGAATGAAEAGAGSGEVAAAALDEGRRSLERTRDQLPALRQAGVVDAGGKGILLLLDSLASTLRGEELSVKLGPSGPVGAGATEAAGRVKREERFGYEVMYLLDCQDDAVAELRTLGAVGGSLVVVGGRGPLQRPRPHRRTGSRRRAGCGQHRRGLGGAHQVGPRRVGRRSGFQPGPGRGGEPGPGPGGGGASDLSRGGLGGSGRGNPCRTRPRGPGARYTRRRGASGR